jgi:hypothetical protein
LWVVGCGFVICCCVVEDEDEDKDEDEVDVDVDVDVGGGWRAWRKAQAQGLRVRLL